MRSALRVVVGVALALAAGSACGGSPAGRGSTSSRASSADARALHALFAETWDHDMREWPTWASSLGDHRFGDRWPDVSLAAFARREAYDREVLARIERIDRRALSRTDALSWDLFAHKYRDAVAAQRFRLHLQPIHQRGGVQTADELADELPFAAVKDYEAWNTRLASFGAYVDQTVELLAEGIRAGYTHPRVAMERVTAQIDAQIVLDPRKSPFHAPYGAGKIPTAIPAPERERLEADANQHIASVVVPAFRRLRAFWVERYLPACRDTVGAWALPDGPALYAYEVRAHTTTALSPDEVHAIGLREVARIRREMEEVKRRSGFAGTLGEFFTFLRTDKRFYHASGEELLEAYRALGKRIDPELKKVFRRLPKTAYDVAPIPDATAPDTTTAYYREPAADGSRPGTFFVNLYKPESRPKWEMVALALHESVPGHHLQIARAMEDSTMPAFRRHGDYTAYIEGWALYAESLGEEMGLYADPYAKFGQLTYEMWRAVRLVVDTGIHHLRWDRQRAIDFFTESAPRSEHDIVNEVDRYIVWPGQALAYKVGELEIKKLRRARATTLGARFDLKEFHEAVLENGALPLDILAREVTAQR